MDWEEVVANAEAETWKAKEELAEIQRLVDDGILSREMCPEPTYWRWLILKPDELPEKFKHFIPLGEVRF